MTNPFFARSSFLAFPYQVRRSTTVRQNVAFLLPPSRSTGVSAGNIWTDHCRDDSSSSSSTSSRTPASISLSSPRTLMPLAMEMSTTRSFSSFQPAKTSKDGVVGHPIDFDVNSKIEGQESQIVTISLQPGQILRAESGAMMYMTNGVTMNTTTGGGLTEGFKRMLTGQNFFISDYSYDGEPGTFGTVCLGTDFPSKILRLSLGEYGGKLVCQQGALLCASHTVNIEMEFTKSFTGGFFGGEGFVLQALTGEGDVFLKAGGTLIRRDLDDGEELRISSGCLVAFSDGVDYDVQMIKGFQNVIAGGEGLFMTTLKGPGVVWLQGQPPQRMISEIARRVPSGGGLAFGVPIGGGGGGGSGGDSGGGDSGDQK